VSNALKSLTVRDDLPLTESAGGESPVTFAFSFLACYTGLRGEILGRQAANPSGTDNLACIIHIDKMTDCEGELWDLMLAAWQINMLKGMWTYSTDLG
jgi:hypothetical protein